MLDHNNPVLVLGANGETGKRVVKKLVANQYHVRAMVRSLDKAQDLQDVMVGIAVGSVLNPDDLQQALVGVKAVISAMGTRAIKDLTEIEAVEYDFVASLLQLAKASDIEQLVLCSSMGTETPNRYPVIADVLRAKRRAEIALEQSGNAFTIVRPGGLNNQLGGQGVLIQTTLKQGGVISRDDVAEVLVQAILQPQARNKIVEIINQPDALPANRPGLFDF